MNNEISIVPVENMIYEIRCKQVMLDSYLARLYQCKNGTKTINQAVKRHLDRFPREFMFQLSDVERNDLRSQFGTTNEMSRSIPYAFTEQGVAMLATILRTPVATSMSIQIMKAFVAMRHYISRELVNDNVASKLLDHDKRIKTLEETFDNFKEVNNHIFFEGQIYDAYSLMIDIFNKSENEIIIIDNYAYKKLLDIVSRIDKKVVIVSGNMSKELIDKYKSQYNNLSIINNNSFHDRFIIIDRKYLYH